MVAYFRQHKAPGDRLRKTRSVGKHVWMGFVQNGSLGVAKFFVLAEDFGAKDV